MLSVNVFFFWIFFILIGCQRYFSEKELQWGQTCIFSKLGLKLGDSKSFYQSPIIWKRETCASTCSNLYQVSKWSCDSHMCDIGGREPPFSCLLAWALTWGAYQLIQDLREDAIYSGYTLFPCPKATFIFRKWFRRMRMWVYKFWKQYMWGFCV